MGTASFKYASFITYSHADEASARWLHQRLESYRVPWRLVGSAGAHGPLPRRIGRCFRDQVELSAASHLGETLQQALRCSQTLIIVCSPRSAASRWVNEEIGYFRSLGRHNRIYALIVDGQPKAEDPDLECFPPAMLKGDDGQPLHEPLAADARPGRDGRDDAFLKLAAGLLGVDFDELRRRDQRRHTHQMLAAVAASLGVAVVTGVLAVSAHLARNEATQRKAQADDLINFMLGDLLERLTPVGRVDVLDAVTTKVIGYLDYGQDAALNEAALKQKINVLRSVAHVQGIRRQIPEALQTANTAVTSARELLRRQADAEAHHLLGRALIPTINLLLETGQFEAAHKANTEGLALSQKALAGRPGDFETMHDVALFRGFSAFFHDMNGDYGNALREFEACAQQAQALARQPEAKPDHTRLYYQCRGAAANKLARERTLDEAVAEYQALLAEEEAALALRPDDMILIEALQSDTALATSNYLEAGRLDLAEAASKRSAELGRRMLERDPGNQDWKYQLGVALWSLSELEVARENWEALEQSATAEIELFQELLDMNPRSSRTRERVLVAYAHRSRARLQRGQQASALSDRRAILALGAEVDLPQIQLKVLSARLHIWEQIWATDAQGAADERLAAAELLQRLANAPDVTASPLWNILLKRNQMQFAYLAGDVAGGDLRFQELNAIDTSARRENQNLRGRLCANLARRPGPHCREENGRGFGLSPTAHRQ